MSWWSKNLPEACNANEDFINYMQTDGISDQYAPILMITLPSPRYKYYQHKSFATIKQGVLDYADEIIKDLGNF